MSKECPEIKKDIHKGRQSSTSRAILDVLKVSKDASHPVLPRVRSFFCFEICFKWLNKDSVELQKRASTARPVASVVPFSSTHQYPYFF